MTKPTTHIYIFDGLMLSGDDPLTTSDVSFFICRTIEEICTFVNKFGFEFTPNNYQDIKDIKTDDLDLKNKLTILINMIVLISNFHSEHDEVKKAYLLIRLISNATCLSQSTFDVALTVEEHHSLYESTEKQIALSQLEYSKERLIEAGTDKEELEQELEQIRQIKQSQRNKIKKAVRESERASHARERKQKVLIDIKNGIIDRHKLARRHGYTPESIDKIKRELKKQS